MRRMFVLFLILSGQVYSDTIDHYINISNNIPKMEVKADSQSQAWARSARNILALTNESIYESLTLANESATRAGNPLFCLPIDVQLTPQDLNDLIQQTYMEISSQEANTNKMTVSQVALQGMAKRYPCKSQQNLKISQFNQALGRVGN